MSPEDALCPICGGADLAFGFGLAGGGGIGDYTMCLDCDLIIAKHVRVPGESFLFAPPAPDDGETE